MDLARFLFVAIGSDRCLNGSLKPRQRQENVAGEAGAEADQGLGATRRVAAEDRISKELIAASKKTKAVGAQPGQVLQRANHYAANCRRHSSDWWGCLVARRSWNL